MNKFLFILIFSFLFIFPQNIFAATITAIPPKIDIEANPGEVYTTTLKVINGDNKTNLYTIRVNDFIVADDIGTPLPIDTTPENNRWAMKHWISAPTVVPVDANSTQVVKVTIRVPKYALPGGHYAMVTFDPSPDRNSTNPIMTASQIGQRVGTLLYLRVRGAVAEKANLYSFQTSRFQEVGPVEFTANIENQSSIHITPKGVIRVYDFLNRQVAELPVEVGNIFPETDKRFASSWNTRFGYGRYRAVLELSYGSAGAVLTSLIYFWLFPFRAVMYSLVIIVGILTVIIFLNKRNQKHQQEMEREIAELKHEIESLEN